ncbi:glycosyltransferase [Cohnella lupini]|uniref:Glycosyltransferase involved in cell wall biosynthesis n=1 Tax=Cohnella lupini TaxID=1294267 RepID=A0A3D9I913_9BACL|nr:glycosyltransferase [Cohnella lupini]RED57646.1 glycosyltransferase involved in cell wall biosynthesis [Cohnella lupini]
MKALIYKMIYKMALPMKRVIVLLIPQSTRRKLKHSIVNKAYNEDLTNLNVKADGGMEVNPTGINLIGYSRAEMGIGESCRIAAKSIATTMIPFNIINYYGTNSARMSDTTWKHKEVKEAEYNVNIFHLNAEQMFEAYTQFGNKLFEERYNIGFWHWELEDFPEEWLEGFKFVNEVWVPSSFVANSVSMKSPVPVVRIPHSIEVKIDTPRERSYYNLPERSFLFLTMYDMNSFQQRKNPIASIDAFKSAFDPNDLTVGLVVKVNNANSNREDIKTITQIVEGYNNIYLIKEILNRNDTNALIQCTDSYISLHRSEGFGLGLAEAMYLSKPVIGTNWSANTDFMNMQNSCLVHYNLIKVGNDYGPYHAYQTWADPDLNHASQYMVRLVNDKVYYKEIALNGEQTIKRDFSPSAIGKMIEKRLRYIQKHSGGRANDN